MWRKTLLMGLVSALALSFAFAGATNVIGEDNSEIGLIKAKIENNETLTPSEKEIASKNGLFETFSAPQPYYNPSSLRTDYLTEGFEVWPPANWTLDPASGSGAWLQGDGTYHGPGSVVDGSYSAYFDVWNYSSGVSGSMMTPAVDLSSATAPRVRFQHWNSSGSDPVDLSVSTDGTTFTSIWTGGTSVSAWEEVIVDLSSYVGTATVYLKFSCTSDYGSTNANLDVFTVEEAPTDPIIGLSAASLDFGGVLPSMSKDMTLTVSNTGGAALNISSIYSTNDAYTVDMTSATVAASGTQDIVVTFAPFMSVEYNESLVIVSDAASSPDTVALMGEGAPTSGGPSAGGYSWISSFDAAGPTFAWIDSTGSTSAGIANGDDYRGTITLPFPFRYEGTIYNEITGTTNGWIGMGPSSGYTSSYYSNVTMPNSSNPNNVIAPFWDDLKAGGSYHGTMVYKTVGTEPNRQFVLIWQDVYRTGAAADDYYTFEVILDEATSDIYFQYLDVSIGSSSYDNGGSATVGIENADGTDALLVGYNGSPQGVYDGEVIHFIAPPPPSLPNMVLSPMELNFGTAPAGGSATMDVLITNNGSGDLVVSGATVAAPFSTTFSGTIPENGSATATISFDPTVAGNFTETLTFTVTGDYTGDDAVVLNGSAFPADFMLEDFENGFPPFGWTIIDVDGGSAINPALSYIDPFSGAVAAEGMGCQDDYLITPLIAVPTGYADMSFWVGQESVNYQNSFEIMVSTTGTEVADFTQLADFPDFTRDAANDWQMVSVDLSSYAGQEVYVAFHVYYSESSYWGFGFDDILLPPMVPSSNTPFFSEYMEGSSNNKGLEIFNGTGAAINLDEYQIAQGVNGSDWQYFHVFPAGAVLEHGDIWLIVTDSSFPRMQAMADEILSYPGVVFHNGDDARALVHIVNGDTTVVDMIGMIDGVDPGTGWAVAGVDAATANHNLMRKETVTTGNADWAASAGTNADDSEWEVYDQDFYYGMGFFMEDYPLPGEACDLAFEYGNTNDPAVSGSIESYGANWYHFYNDGSFDDVIVSLCGSGFDTKIEVWDDCGATNYLAYNDDACGLQSEVSFSMLPAGDYYVKVYGYSSSSGDYTLTITGTIGMPDFVVSSMEYYGQDTLDVVVTNQGEADSYGWFGTDYHGLYIDGTYLGYVAEDGVALMAGESYTYTLIGINYDFLGAGLHEVVFEADTDNDVDEADETNNLDTLVIDILVPPATPRHLMASVSGEQINLTWDPAPEESYTMPGALIRGVLDNKVKNLTESQDVIQKWNDIANQSAIREVGDDCTDPFIVAALPYSDTSSTVGHTNAFSYGAGNDVVYRVTVSEAGYLYANTCATATGDTKLEIYAAGDCTTPLVQNDDACGLRSEVMTAVTAGDYMVVVDKYGSGDIDFIVDIFFATEMLAPDLTVSDMWFEDETVYAEISNIGTIDVTSSSVSCRWYVDGDYIGYQYPRPLEAGGSDTLAITGFSYANLGPGTFNVQMIVDYWDSVTEGDETNNEDSLSVTVDEPDYIPTFNVYRNAALVAEGLEPIDFAFHGGYVDWGLAVGDYCYTVTQIMPDASESDPSNEACAMITPNPPVGLNLMVNPDASATLSWMAPLPSGELGYDDGTAESWMWVGGPSSTDHMMALRFNAPFGEFNITNVSVFGLGDEPTAFESVYIVGGDGFGAPDMSNVLMAIPDVAMNGTWDTGAEWSIVPAGVAATNSEFFVVLQWMDGSEVGPFVGTDDNTTSVNSFWSNTAGTTWNTWAGMFMIHAFLEVGGDVVSIGPSEPVIRNISTPEVPAMVAVSTEAPEFGFVPTDRAFLGTFKVHRGMEPGVYDTVLVADLADNMFTDAPDMGDMEYFYAVSANYDEGDSPFSNEVSYMPEALPWMDLAINFEDMDVDIPYGGTYASTSFDIMSIGLDTLEYMIEYHAPMGRVVSREIDGANMYSLDMPPQPGETVDIVVMLQNDSQDTEWLDSASVTFPLGITVNSSTDFVVVDNATHYLATNGATGDGATVEFFDHNGSYGNIYGAELAMSTINITVDAAYTGDVYFDYHISGDDWGADPHDVWGSFVFMDPAFIVSFTPYMNMLLPDSTDEILVEVETIEYQPGFYPGYISIFSNAVNAPEEFMFPFNVKLAPPTGMLAGTVTSAYDDAPMEMVIIGAVETTTFDEYFTETAADGSYEMELPVGNYDIGMGYHDYHPIGMNVDIVMDQTTIVDVAMEPDVMAPVALDAYEDGGVHLTWDMPEAEMLIAYHDGSPTSGFYQNWGQAYGVVFDLSMYANASIEYADFVHYAWGLGGLFDYNLHVIDWTDYSIIASYNNLSTTMDAGAAPVLEYGLDLGGYSGYTQVGIFIEPLGGVATDAYPDVSTDASAPALANSSFIIDLAEIDNSYDISVQNPTIGDFMINLWILADDGTVVAAEGIGAGQQTGAAAMIAETKGTISGWTGIGLPMDDSALRSEFLHFSIYSNVDGAGWNMIGTSDSLGYIDNSVMPDQSIEYTVSAMYDIGESATTDTVWIYVVNTDNVGLPEQYALHQNYPNPFNPTTYIRYELPEATDVKIVVYNVLGQKVATLVDQNMNAGYHNISWSGLNQHGSPVSSGVYLYRIETENFTDVKKLMFLK